jgi:excisionase family DNA binding protein
MQAVILTGDTYAQLLEDVRAVVRHELQHTPAAPPAPAGPPADELLTIREAAALLDVTVQTVHDWKRRGLLKFHKLGSRSYLKRGETLAALTAQQRTLKPSKGANPGTPKPARKVGKEASNA